MIDDEALNYIGDRLMTGDRNAGIALFELNVIDHPRSSRAHEFVAEAYAADGRNALAIQLVPSHLDTLNELRHHAPSS